MKRAVVAERKRHPDVPPDGAAVGHFGPGQETDQRRLARTVGAEDAEIVPCREFRRRVVENQPAPGGRRIGFADRVERDHSGALSLRRNPRCSAKPTSSARMARTTR